MARTIEPHLLGVQMNGMTWKGVPFAPRFELDEETEICWDPETMRALDQGRKEMRQRDGKDR